MNRRPIGRQGASVYSHGCGGTHAAEGIEKLGLAAQLKPKTKFVDDGPVVEFLTRGDFEIGIQQTNIMVGATPQDPRGAGRTLIAAEPSW